MFRIHDLMWDSHLVEINVTINWVDLLPDCRLLNSPQYRAAPKTRELIKPEFKKQLDAGVCEPAHR